ncbi:hypothetical protein [Pseudoflavonifractor sp. MSJ-37]|uniref:hypothetical protein n=1 Tax=Pseudoflavonifractor sp. MSJ-37 TaxID=2841531 RepID=UPI001C11CF81|nr:hypothetical protein [Pseudoflavonifractor sp. MSJ-37]MBU5436191.1 hypothetical protein [Pseudoflavonifractor sp. MSJ-37]
MEDRNLDWRIRRLGTALLCLTMAVSCAGCSSGVGNDSSTADSTQSDEFSKPLGDREKDNSSPENDTAMGLKNIKVDSSTVELTDEQKAVIEYFDEDYLQLTDYEFMRRYPDLFQGAQVSVYGAVIKVLSMDEDNYEIVIWANVVPYGMAYDEEAYKQMYGGQYIVLRGKTDPAGWYMENDVLMGYGRYTGVETVDIDGTSYTIPCVNVYHANQAAEDAGIIISERFDAATVKTVAKTIFHDIEFRKAALDDFTEETALLLLNTTGGGNYYSLEEAEESAAEFGYDLSDSLPYYTVELEDQSNANFTKFLFAKDGGEIIDAKDPVFNDTIRRCVEFSADFEHYFVFTYDTSLEALKLGYYDKDLHKVWEREFEETTSAVYDYTKNNIYLVANNQLYVINTETGEDTFAPAYVGARMAIRKFEDGVLMVSASRSDGIVKSGLDGAIQWTANLIADVEDVGGVQLVDGNLVLQYTDETWEDHYALVNYETGEVMLNI